TAEHWIQVKAAGNAAILDSADYLSGSIWTSTSTAKVWFTKIGGPVAYLSRGGNRFYQYDDKTGLMQAKGHGGVTINEGWYYEASTQRLYIRNLDNPANYMWRLPRLNHAFDIAARDWIWIEGFEIRFYGTTTNGCGVCTLNASHVVVRNNKIHNMQLGIFINWTGGADRGNDTRIEGNEVYDPLVNEWPWAAVKGSFMEGTGIIIRGHTGAIVHDNNVHNFFNGIYSGSSGALENTELAFDADIYRNTIHQISDDALEPEGACVNQRFRNNTVDRIFIGISLAPVTQGPVWVLRSTFTNFTGRGIKFADNSDGNVLIYHNTGWTSATNINGADLITPIHNVIMRNNVFQSTGYSFAEVPTGSTANDWNNDNWYTTRGSTGPHFRWENVNFNTISALCGATGLECNGYESVPGFTNPTGGDFTLLSSSPNIDRGVVLPGINDNFVGNAPDVGAYEFVSEYSISGNTGAGEVVLSYMNGISRTVISQADGSYSFQVPSGWSGTVTPTHPCFTFDPAYHSYSNLGADQSAQDFVASFNASAGCSDVDVEIGSTLQGRFGLPAGDSTRASFTGVNAGPVKIESTNAIALIAAERVIYKVGGVDTSFTEMMGLPASQLDTTYWLPWYNNKDLDTQLRFANVSASTATVHVYVGGVEMTGSPFSLTPGASTRKSFVGINNGPVKIESDVKIVAAERLIYKAAGNVAVSFSEMMALPDSQLDTTYWLPWY
ncbi:MAG TPA: right-handed parallel beta-helix repeat-containing protein, partial [Anaerolineales bacterium]|nr:right-handed parallel beta-helix repeat-containing protein [Anaerolineales bacterium]